jgi:predicted nucleic acid-binding protein
MSSAVLDANVLYSASLRDFLLRLAFDGLFAPHWTVKIQDEWVENLLLKRPELKRERLLRTCAEMDSHFPNGRVRGFEPIIETLILPDKKDRHVVAAALQAKAKYVVTFNLRDFPKAAIPSRIEVISPDEFVFRIIENDPSTFIETVSKHRASLARPSKTVDEYLETLEQQKLHKTVEFLRQHKDKI